MHKSFSLMETEKEATGNALCLCLGLSLLCPYAESPLPRHICKLWHSYETQQPKFSQQNHQRSFSLSPCVSVSLFLSPSFLTAQKFLLNRQCSVLTRTENRRIKPTKEIASFIPFLFFLSFFHRNRNSDNKPKLPNSAFAALTNTKTSSSSENTPKNSAKPGAENGAMDCARKENLANPWRREEGGGGAKPVST